ncbi:MAG: proline racemase [Verrucomicrobiales bacterium]|nr:proline racemase [Verrucomicrobiales bacterium]
MVTFPLIPPRALHEWALPSHGLSVDTIDAHSGGQTLRLITGGLPPLRGATMMDRWRNARDHFDHLRRSLLCEPRGHPDMCGCILTPPQRGDSHLGAVFLHAGGFSPMCGHGIIALTTILLECGMVDSTAPETVLRIDTPAGTVRASGFTEDDQVTRVRFENVPSWSVAESQEVEIPGLGQVRFDLAYGGAFFAFVTAASLGVSTQAENIQELAATGRAFLQAVHGKLRLRHPVEPDLEHLFGVVFLDESEADGRAPSGISRQVCVFADGSVDRSPTGMALCARLALMAGQGRLTEGQPLTVEGITGTRFQGRIIGPAQRDAHNPPNSVICEIEGSAWITGRHTFLISPDDPFREGFSL